MRLTDGASDAPEVGAGRRRETFSVRTRRGRATRQMGSAEGLEA